METMMMTATMILNMYMNMCGQPVNSDYMYNAEMMDGKVSSICVYEKDLNSYEQKLKHVYTYDVQDRVVRKETLKWNAVKSEWQNSSCIDYSYEDDGVALTYARWNAKEGKYDSSRQRTEYHYVADSVVGVDEYVWNDGQQELECAQSYLLMSPALNDLMAGVRTTK